MHRLVNCVGALIAVAVALAVAGAAYAESRLFTVRASQPNVTITQAWQNGAQLPVGGRNGADTIFRLDNPAGPVPCLNHLQFVGSNGGSVDTTADLCSSNWDLTVALAPGVPGTAPAPAAGQPLVIATDDPNVTITGVFLRGQPVTIIARHDPYVQITAPSDPAGFACQRDLGLALSDGRRIARSVDICQSNYLVVIALVGGPLPPPPPPSMQVATQPPAQQQASPVPAPQPYLPAPQPTDNMTWQFSTEGNSASLSYAAPNSESGEFTATCMPGTGAAKVTLLPTSDELGPGAQATIRFTTDAFDKSYTATGSDVGTADGLSHPILQIAMTDPFWSAIVSGKTLTIGVGSSPGVVLSLSGSGSRTRQFLAFCNPQPATQFPPGQAQPLAPPPLTANGTPSQAIFACDDGALLRITYNGTSVVVSEAGNAPIVLPSAGGQRWAAGLSQLTAQGPGVIWVRNGTYPRTCMPQ